MKPITLSPDTKLIGLNVYRTRYDFQGGKESDCTNGGASAKVNTIYIPHHEGYMRVRDVDPAIVFVPEQRGSNYWALNPAFPPPGSDRVLVGPMCGGNLATTSDSRGGGIIYHIHDRFETYEVYEAMSR